METSKYPMHAIDTKKVRDIPIAHGRVEGPTTCLVFLVITLDTETFSGKGSENEGKY